MATGDHLNLTADTSEAQRVAAQREVLGRVADRLGQLHLAAPAIFVLESIKPLSFLSSQALVFLGPIVQALFPLRDYQLFAEALESRPNVEWFICRLEELEEGGAPCPPEEAPDAP